MRWCGLATAHVQARPEDKATPASALQSRTVRATQHSCEPPQIAHCDRSKFENGKAIKDTAAFSNPKMLRYGEVFPGTEFDVRTVPSNRIDSTFSLFFCSGSLADLLPPIMDGAHGRGSARTTLTCLFDRPAVLKYCYVVRSLRDLHKRRKGRHTTRAILAQVRAFQKMHTNP